MFIDELFRCIDAITLIHLPEGPSAYFKLSSFVPSKKLPVSFFFDGNYREIYMLKWECD